MAGKTEWEDALIKHGIMKAPVKLPTEDELALREIEKMEKIDINEKKTLSDLEKEEDDLEEDTLETLRAKRITEMKAKSARDKFGHVKSIDQQTFVQEVTEASKEPGLFVICCLYVYSKEQCIKLNQLLDVVAGKFKHIKFVKIISKEAIPNFPGCAYSFSLTVGDESTPTILVYHNGDIFRQIVGLESFGGAKATPLSVEWALANFGILKTELQDDPLDATRGRTKITKKVKNKKAYSSDEDDFSED